MDVQPDSHLCRSPRSTAQHPQHPYIIPGRKPLTYANVVPSTQLITSTLIPDLTGLITRCSPDPVSGGTYGNIYKCIYHGPEGDEEVAVKVIRPQFVSAEMFRRELGIWKRLRHSNILKLIGTTSDFGPSVALVAPWITNGTLTSFLDQNNETLGLRDRLLLLRDIAAGLDYLHTFNLIKDEHVDLNPVIHGDLTGTNVLIDGDRKAYLADFGLSGTFEKLTGMTYLAKLTGHPGAVRWAAPELLSGEESASAATTQSDMYSFGNIMLQVLTGNVPWCHLARDFQITYQVVIQRKIHPRPHSVHVTDRHWNFMTRCWSMSFGDRPPAKEAVQFVDGALHSSTSPQSPTLSVSSDVGYQGIASNDYVRGDADTRLPVMDLNSPWDVRDDYSGIIDQGPSTLSSVDYTSPSTSPQTPTLSISSDERHPGIARNDYLRGDTDARLPVMQDIDSPLDPRENHPGVMLPAYPSTTSYATSLEPSWTQSNLPRPHTSDFSATYHAYFPDEDDYNIIPPGYLLPKSVNYNNTMHHNWVNLNKQQNASLQHYMQHVLRIQYLHVDGSIDKLIWKLIHSSDSAQEAACLLADLHCKSTQGAIGFTDRDVYTRIQRALVVPVTEGDAFANLCMVSYFLFTGGQGQWQAFLDSACEFSIKVLQRNHVAPGWALISCTDSMRFIIKTSMWFDVLASATLIRRPKFLEVLRSLYGPTTAVNGGRPELSMMGVMGCENRIVLALAEIADLAYWKDGCRRAGRLSVSELVRRGQDIETILKSTNDSAYLRGFDTKKSRRRRLTSDVFRASALVYLHSVISGDHPQCPEIMGNITETVKCLRRAEDVSTARHVVRSVVFSICICGCLTDVPAHRKYFLQRLHEQQTQTVGNCGQVAQLIREVWNSRERGEPVDWRVVMQQAQMLLV